MANLRVDKITSTETFETTGSVQFDGSGDYLSHAVSSDFQLGSDDFTIECWIYKEATQNDDILGVYNTSSNRRSFLLHTPSEGTIVFILSPTGSGGTSFTTDENIIEPSTWYHIAVVRNGDDVKIFKDGSLVKSGSYTGSVYENNDDEFRIGSTHYSAANSREFDGHISNVRIIKGKALYTENFKVPMRELEVTPETVLLACQSKTDATLEKTGKTITVNGNAVASELTPGLLTPVPKAGAGSAITGSVEFDGTGDYLSVQSSTDFDFGTGDFTIELYANLGNLTNRNIFARNDSNPSNTGILLWQNGSSQLQWYSSVGNNTGVITVTTPLTLHEWAHIAVSRESNTTRLFANGVLIGSTSDNTDISGDSVLNIGSTFAGTLYYVKGFISNLRIVKGTALYTDDFIPPTRELKKVPGTVLLCCQDPDNPLTESTGKTITGYGDLDQSYGDELVTNGQFTADSDWTKGTQWTISGGSASITDSPDRGSDSLLTQDASSWIQAGQVYRVTVDWSFSSGDFDVRLGGDSTYTEYSIESSQSSPYIFNIRAGATNDNLDIIANQHAVGDINSISVEKLPPSRTGSNFTPQVGDDRKVTFEGVTKINTENYFYLPTGDTVSRETTGTYNAGTRGIFGGGFIGPGASDHRDTIQYINIATTGNAVDAGDLTVSRYGNAALASATRAVWAGGIVPTPAIYNTIDAVEIMSTGNAFDFGDLYNTVYYPAGFSNRTRGIYTGGAQPTLQNDIGYITISSKGNSVDFGNLITARNAHATFGSPTRGVIAGGWISPVRTNSMEYVTIASTGNAADFGDLTQERNYGGGCGSAVRGLVGGGNPGTSPNADDLIDYVTISAMGNAQDFGDLTAARTEIGSCSSATRGVFAGAWSPSKVNTIDFVTIQTTSNAKDFGDLVNVGVMQECGTSNGHGGLG